MLNVSRGGLFVQTTSAPPPGQDVRVELNLAVAIPIAAQVVWRRVVARHLWTVSQGGVGLRIHSAPEAYQQFLSEVAAEPSAGTDQPAATNGAAPGPARREVQFRVRIKREGGSRTRTMVLGCTSEEEARRRALAQAGRGWGILELDRL